MTSDPRDAGKGIGESASILLLAAKADAEFGKRLRLVLRLPSFHRKSMISSALAEMQVKGEPLQLIQAMALLADEVTAAKILDYLEQ